MFATIHALKDFRMAVQLYYDFCRYYSCFGTACLPDCACRHGIKSNCWHTYIKGPAHFPMRSTRPGWRLDVCEPIALFTVAFKCSMCRFSGLLAPRFPLYSQSVTITAAAVAVATVSKCTEVATLEPQCSSWSSWQRCSLALLARFTVS